MYTCCPGCPRSMTSPYEDRSTREITLESPLERRGPFGIPYGLLEILEGPAQWLIQPIKMGRLRPIKSIDARGISPYLKVTAWDLDFSSLFISFRFGLELCRWRKGRWRGFDARESAARPSSPRTITRKMPADIMTPYGFLPPNSRTPPFTLLLLIWAVCVMIHEPYETISGVNFVLVCNSARDWWWRGRRMIDIAIVDWRTSLGFFVLEL